MKNSNFLSAKSRFLTLRKRIITPVVCHCSFLLILFLTGAMLSADAQERKPLPTRHQNDFALDEPKKCFEYDLSLDVINQSTPRDKSIIVISRLGDKDTKPNLGKRRLHNIRTYWTKYLSEPVRRNPETVILAEGDPVKGYGQVEFYVHGELVEILKLVPNGDFPAALCYMLPDEPQCAEEKQKLFYPCKDKSIRRRIKTTKK